ncbi:MAG: PIN domain-containing protein [Candidatus Binatia bacterium]
MIFLLDTNAFSDLMRKHSKLDARMSSLLAADRVVICPVVRGEIRYGIEQLPRSRRRQDLEDQAAPLFNVIPCESIPETAGDHYARIKLTRQHKGLTLDENDLWIAATAFALGAVLISRDSDFQQIDGLGVNDWTA